MAAAAVVVTITKEKTPRQNDARIFIVVKKRGAWGMPGVDLVRQNVRRLYSGKGNRSIPANF
jgi:hypothetical protein